MVVVETGAFFRHIDCLFALLSFIVYVSCLIVLCVCVFVVRL